MQGFLTPTQNGNYIWSIGPCQQDDDSWVQQDFCQMDACSKAREPNSQPNLQCSKEENFPFHHTPPPPQICKYQHRQGRFTNKKELRWKKKRRRGGEGRLVENDLIPAATQSFARHSICPEGEEGMQGEQSRGREIIGSLRYHPASMEE